MILLMGWPKKIVRYMWLHGWKYRATERAHRRYVAEMGRRRPVRVVFIAMSVAMWRYQHLYELLAADPRFDVHIVLSPSIDYAPEQRAHDEELMERYFAKRGIAVVPWTGDDHAVNIRADFDPDLLFYPQPYEHLLLPEHDCTSFYDRLICYYPYAFWTSTGKWSYDFHFHNLAWRLYYSTTMHLAEAMKVATNHGRNVRVVGYPNADDFLLSDHTDVWKPQSAPCKRVVWAPHYSVTAEFGLPPRSNFLWMASLMLQLAEQYRDKLQLAFKPHPRLLTELYAHPEWGKSRADAYYKQWETGVNTQLETGEFIDLFMTSDAMIHDSGSFAVEYHYSRRPVMFVSNDMEPIMRTQSDFGKKVYELHYIGGDEVAVRHFVDDVVIAGNDPLLDEREEFFNRYLLPPGGNSVAQNTLDDIVESLQLSEKS